MQFFSNTHIDFLGKRRIFYVVSIVITVAGIVGALVRGVELGIDFEGGAEAAFDLGSSVNLTDVRSAVEEAGYTGAEVKRYGAAGEVLIRIKGSEADLEEGTSELSASLQQQLQQRFGEGIELLKIDAIGPKIGAELRTDAIWAIVVAVIAILIYITFRFEILYGLGAIIALLHDVLVAFAFAVLFNGVFGLNLEMNQALLAAFLTVVGFSINDTVIIFDRIRENKTIHRSENMMMLINRSINEVLPRTINTSLTVVLVLLILLFFSGDVLQGFAFTMMIGILTGTYSSIYIASSFVVDSLVKQGKLDPDAERDFSEHVVQERTRRREGKLAARAKA